MLKEESPEKKITELSIKQMQETVAKHSDKNNKFIKLKLPNSTIKPKHKITISVDKLDSMKFSYINKQPLNKGRSDLVKNSLTLNPYKNRKSVDGNPVAIVTKNYIGNIVNRSNRKSTYN